MRYDLSHWALAGACLLAGSLGCDPTGGGDAGLDATDGASEDAVAFDADSDASSEDAGTPLDAMDDASLEDGGGEADGGCDVCTPPECYVALGCAPTCELAPAPEGTPCGSPGDVCMLGTCVGPGVGCGNGIRETTPTREGCDDGNLVAGDACSPSCTPSLVVLSALAPNAGSDVSGAVDGTGAVLFAWVESEPSMGERALAVRAAILGPAGVREGTVFTLESNLGVGQAVTPVVAGLPNGWAVAWRSTFVEGSDRDQGGIAFRIVRRDGTLGSLRQANTEERFDQREPSIAANDTGFIVAWTDTSDRARDPGLGVRARHFNVLGGALGDEMLVATTVAGDQSQPTLACAERSSVWAIAFTDTSTGMPVTVLRRYDGTTPTDPAPVALGAGWRSNARISPPVYTSGDLWTAWLARDEDPMGQGNALFVPALDAPDVGEVLVFGDPDLDRRDDGVAIAGISDFEAVVGWRTDVVPQGLRLSAVGWTFPPEGPELEMLMRGGRQRGLIFVPTFRGLWLAWTDESIPGTTSAAVAYLLPWD